MDPARAAGQPDPAADPPRPGPAQVVLTTPPRGLLCNDPGHRNAGRRADVLVTFGVLGGYGRRDAFWPEVWGRTYPFCQACWTQTLAVLEHARPSLSVREVRTL